MNSEVTVEKILSYVNLLAVAREKEAKPFTPFDDEVPVSGTKFNRFDLVQLVNAALSGWVTEGAYCKEFTRKLCKYTKINHSILCNSGSSADLLAIIALKEIYQPPPQSLVVTTALSFATTVAAILHAGMYPYFVDSDVRTLNPDPAELILLADKPEVVGIVITHTLGFPVDMREVATEYRKRNKFVVEDCCDALGSFIDNDHVGTFGDAATFSFFPAHQISTGEGGAVLTNSGKLYEVIRSYRNWGRDCWCLPGEINTCGKRFDQEFPKLPEHYDHKYIFSRPGFNFQMTDLQGALGSSQMDRIKEITSRRKSNYAYLLQGLAAIDSFDHAFQVVENPFDFSPFGFPLIYNYAPHRLIQFLEDRKIRTRPVFAGNITRQPMMDHIPYVQMDGMNGADYIMEHAFWIGCHPELGTSQLSFVIDSIAEYLEK